VIDSGGKSLTLDKWSLTSGTRRIEGLPEKLGHEFLEFREEKSTDYHNGILTLVPIRALKQIDYDPEKKLAVVAVAAENRDVQLTGTTRFKGINFLAGNGVSKAGPTKFQGGAIPKGGVRSLRFAAFEPVPSPGKLGWLALASDKGEHALSNLGSLVRIGTGSRSFDHLFFKVNVKVVPAKIVSMRRVESEDKKSTVADFQVAWKAGGSHALTFHDVPPVADAQPTALVGLLGRVDVGYKVFPVHTLMSLRIASEPPGLQKRPECVD
jgi:hypothetical protein